MSNLPRATRDSYGHNFMRTSVLSQVYLSMADLPPQLPICRRKLRGPFSKKIFEPRQPQAVSSQAPPPDLS
ncbi:hypothetical protein TNCT_216131 [Trichonephila clavata]|uniref:Uncharacterized protein n=1 Tax=Trichonephila clavata TaxID=2740835 RepID=A0A8X6FH13_TRICU|nr:hypothetical protein TNCT_216131 [Trichonephila clavata]